MQQIKAALEELKAGIATQLNKEAESAATIMEALRDRILDMQEFKALKADQQQELRHAFARKLDEVNDQRLIAALRDIPRRFEDEDYPRLLGKMESWGNRSSSGDSNYPRPSDQGKGENADPSYVPVRSVFLTGDRVYGIGAATITVAGKVLTGYMNKVCDRQPGLQIPQVEVAVIEGVTVGWIDAQLDIGLFISDTKVGVARFFRGKADGGQGKPGYCERRQSDARSHETRSHPNPPCGRDELPRIRCPALGTIANRGPQTTVCRRHEVVRQSLSRLCQLRYCPRAMQRPVRQLYKVAPGDSVCICI